MAADRQHVDHIPTCHQACLLPQPTPSLLLFLLGVGHGIWTLYAVHVFYWTISYPTTPPHLLPYLYCAARCSTQHLFIWNSILCGFLLFT